MKTKPDRRTIPLELVVRSTELRVAELLNNASDGSIRLVVLLSEEEMSLLLDRPDDSDLENESFLLKDIWASRLGAGSDAHAYQMKETWLADIKPVAWLLENRCRSQVNAEVGAITVGVRLRISSHLEKAQRRPVRLNEIVMLPDDYVAAGFSVGRLRSLREEDLTAGSTSTSSYPSRATHLKMLGLMAKVLASRTAEEEGDSPFGTEDDPNVAGIVIEALGLLRGEERGLSEHHFADQVNAGLQLLSGKMRKRGRKPKSA